MSNFEPFDVIALILILGSIGMMIAGAITANADLFENSRYIVVSIVSAYVGKKWNKNKD